MPVITIQPGPVDGRDVFVYSTYPDTNYRTATYVRNGPNFHSWAIPDFGQFIRSLIPIGSIINSATLSLKCYQRDNPWASATYNLWAALNHPVWWAYDFTTVTWNTRPTTQFVLYLSGLSRPIPGFWYDIPVKQYVENCLQVWFPPPLPPGPNLWHGPLIFADGATGSEYCYFRSSRYATDPTERPKLTIDYTPPPAIPDRDRDEETQTLVIVP